MKCEKCNQEIKEDKIPTKIYEDLGIEVETKVHHHGIAFKDIKIPEGWRLLTYDEGIKLLNKEEFVELIKFKEENKDFFIQQPFKNNKDDVAWLGCDDSGFDLYAVNILGIRGAFRGVLFCRDLYQKLGSPLGQGVLAPKKESEEIKIFEGDNLQKAVDKCLDEGYFPATYEEVYKLIKSEKIPNNWYDISNIIYKGEIRKATKEELRNLQKVYDGDGRMLFVINSNYGLNGYLNLSNVGRFVGIKEE